MKIKRIYVEITNICNKQCSFCSINNRPKQEMSVANFEYIIKEIKPITNYIYLHVKGEPLLHSQLNKILSLCDQYKIHVNITTNGTLLHSKVQIINSHPCIRQINISLNSEEHPNKKYLNQILSSIQTIQNDQERYIVYRLWAQPNNQLSLPSHPMLNILGNFYQVSYDIKEKIKETNNIKLQKNIYLNRQAQFEWPNLKNPTQSITGTCHGLKDHFAILVDGTVVPCCLDSDGVINLGNIFKTPISQILNNEKTKQILKGYQCNTLIEELCQKCSYRLRFNKKSTKV